MELQLDYCMDIFSLFADLLGNSLEEELLFKLIWLPMAIPLHFCDCYCTVPINSEAWMC